MTNNPITRESYEAASLEIFAEIGRAIDEWSNVEQWLHDIFTRTASVGPSFTTALSASFWSVQSVGGKLSLIEAAISNQSFGTAQDTSIFADWRTVKNKLERRNNNRNKLAHGALISPVIVLSGPPVAFPVWVPYYDHIGYKLFKATPVQERGKARKFDELTAQDIASFRSGFVEVAQALSEFFHAHLSPRQKSGL